MSREEWRERARDEAVAAFGASSRRRSLWRPSMIRRRATSPGSRRTRLLTLAFYEVAMAPYATVVVIAGKNRESVARGPPPDASDRAIIDVEALGRREANRTPGLTASGLHETHGLHHRRGARSIVGGGRACWVPIEMRADEYHLLAQIGASDVRQHVDVVGRLLEEFRIGTQPQLRRFPELHQSNKSAKGFVRHGENGRRREVVDARVRRYQAGAVHLSTPGARAEATTTASTPSSRQRSRNAWAAAFVGV